MDYESAVEYMSGLLRFGWKLGNDRFQALLHRLGNPHLAYPVVHIAGTKGKGSTTALAAAIFFHDGAQVLYKYGASDYQFQELRPNL